MKPRKNQIPITTAPFELLETYVAWVSTRQDLRKTGDETTYVTGGIHALVSVVRKFTAQLDEYELKNLGRFLARLFKVARQ